MSDADTTIAHLREELATPSLQSESRETRLIITWVVNLITLFLTFFESVIKEIIDRIADLEDDDTSKVSALRSSTPPVTTSVATTIPSSRRCTKCHARGHTDASCRTTDPAAMRKRVALNQKRKKNARTAAAAATAMPPPSLPSIPTPAPFYGQYPVQTSPQVVATFMADAEELRRRRQQSNRDKRRVRRSAQSDPP
jgi:hypothetical protein